MRPEHKTVPEFLVFNETSPMTTDMAADRFPARFHDYRDLPGDAFYRALILFGFAVVLYLSWRFDTASSAPRAITSGAALSSARRSCGPAWAC